MSYIYRAENCKNHFKIVGKIIFKKEKEKKMTWQLMWRNVRTTVLNATLQFLVIYSYRWIKTVSLPRYLCGIFFYWLAEFSR